MATPKYSYMENSKSDLTGFLIQEGQYGGVMYTYGKVTPVEEDDKLRLKFEYNVHENPNEVDTNSESFINVMGDILAIEVEKDNNGNSGTNREDDPQKFTT